jgi:predicted dehydrogenase
VTEPRLHTALIGCGGMGRRHLRAYAALRAVGLDRFEISAVCDVRREAAEDAATLAEELLGTRPDVYEGPEQLLSSGKVQALDVVTDPAAHHLVVPPALRSGLHVICEKPLGVTVRACQEIVAAAQASGSVLATAENYRRDGPNRLARAVVEAGLLGDLHCMVQQSIGGSDGVIITPWRHQAEAGPIALDMGVHYTDIFRYYLGELESAYGTTFVAEPMRRLDPATAHLVEDQPVRDQPVRDQPVRDQPAPGYIRATGDDSVIASYRAESGVLVQLSYVPSGPGRQFFQRSLHGRAGSMTVPHDRSGGPVVVQLGERALSGAELRAELGGFQLTGAAARFFGPDGTEYDRPFPEVDAATIGIELDDFAVSVIEKGRPEVDGEDGLLAVAAIWAVSESQLAGRPVRIVDVANGSVRAAQERVDAALGLSTGGHPASRPQAVQRR